MADPLSVTDTVLILASVISSTLLGLLLSVGDEQRHFAVHVLILAGLQLSILVALLCGVASTILAVCTSCNHHISLDVYATALLGLLPAAAAAVTVQPRIVAAVFLAADPNLRRGASWNMHLMPKNATEAVEVEKMQVIHWWVQATRSLAIISNPATVRLPSRVAARTAQSLLVDIIRKRQLIVAVAGYHFDYICEKHFAAPRRDRSSTVGSHDWTYGDHSFPFQVCRRVVQALDLVGWDLSSDPPRDIFCTGRGAARRIRVRDDEDITIQALQCSLVFLILAQTSSLFQVRPKPEVALEASLHEHVDELGVPPARVAAKAGVPSAVNGSTPVAIALTPTGAAPPTAGVTPGHVQVCTADHEEMMWQWLGEWKFTDKVSGWTPRTQGSPPMPRTADIMSVSAGVHSP